MGRKAAVGVMGAPTDCRGGKPLVGQFGPLMKTFVCSKARKIILSTGGNRSRVGASARGCLYFPVFIARSPWPKPPRHCEAALGRTHNVIARPLWAEAIFDFLPGSHQGLAQRTLTQGATPARSPSGDLEGTLHNVIARPPWAEATTSLRGRFGSKQSLIPFPGGTNCFGPDARTGPRNDGGVVAESGPAQRIALPA